MPQPYDSRYHQARVVLPPFPAAVRGLIIANVVIHVLQFLAGPEAAFKILDLFALDPARVLGQFWLWQPVSYMFLHHQGDIMHLLFNMLMLWMFGGDLEVRWGASRFLRFYLICGAGAGLVTVAFNWLRGDRAATIGASGAIFGLLMAYGMLFPRRTVLFMGLFPMQARTMVAIFAILQLFFAGAFSRTGIAYFAHLGGMLVAWIYLRGWWDPRRLYAEVRWRLRRRRFRALQRGESDEDRYKYH